MISPTAASRDHCIRQTYPRWRTGTTQSVSNRRRQRAIPTKTMPQALLMILPLLLFSFAAIPAEAAGGVGSISLNIEHTPCIRLFHSDGDVGCRTRGKGGVAGPLLVVDSTRKVEDIEGIAEQRAKAGKLAGEEDEEGVLGLEDGVIAVMPEVMFNSTILERLSATGLLGGVLVLEEEDPNIRRGFLGSPDVATPQVRHFQADSALLLKYNAAMHTIYVHTACAIYVRCSKKVSAASQQSAWSGRQLRAACIECQKSWVHFSF